MTLNIIERGILNKVKVLIKIFFCISKVLLYIIEHPIKYKYYLAEFSYTKPFTKYTVRSLITSLQPSKSESVTWQSI